MILFYKVNTEKVFRLKELRHICPVIKQKLRKYFSLCCIMLNHVMMAK